MSILAASSMLPEFCILLGDGVLAGRASHLTTQPCFVRDTGWVAGSLVLLAGVLVASVKKQD